MSDTLPERLGFTLDIDQYIILFYAIKSKIKNQYYGNTRMMPHFFNLVPEITLVDPLADLLGAAADGRMVYSYGDAVKLAGHSCPTVAGAYLMLHTGLSKLYPDSLPIRGEIHVTIKGVLGEGVAGVIANVATLITGATDDSGFHGLMGNFDRRHLLSFDPDTSWDMILRRTDSGESVSIQYNPAFVPSNPMMVNWMKMILNGSATPEVKQWFKNGWQERVKQILIDFREDARLIRYELGKMS